MVGILTPTRRKREYPVGIILVGLLSQTLIVHMIRTRRVPFIQSCASWPLMIMTVIVMIVGIALPFSPLASYLQLQALPLSYFPVAGCDSGRVYDVNPVGERVL